MGGGRFCFGPLFRAPNNNFINRCEECPLLEDEDDISDEEMELMVR